jgi:hypothetical protein
MPFILLLFPIVLGFAIGWIILTDNNIKCKYMGALSLCISAIFLMWGSYSIYLYNAQIPTTKQVEVITVKDIQVCCPYPNQVVNLTALLGHVVTDKTVTIKYYKTYFVGIDLMTQQSYSIDREN